MKKEEKTVYLVTHGEKNKGNDPLMTTEAFRQMEGLKALIPKIVPLVICGTGRRHQGILLALGLWSRHTKYTALIGGPESLEGDEVFLASGNPVPRDLYITTDIGAPSVLEIFKIVPSNTVFCTGRPVLRMLGIANPKLAAVYMANFSGFPTLNHLQIKEISKPSTEALPK